MKISKEEFYSKYGWAIMSFERYYKHKFVFSGRSYFLDDGVITVEVGGEYNTIYNYDISKNIKIKLRDLDIISGYVTTGGVDISLIEYFEEAI